MTNTPKHTQEDEKRINEIANRARKAESMGRCIMVVPSGWEVDHIVQVYLTGIQGRDGCMTPTDAEFIQHAYDDIPYLLRAVRDLKEPASFGWRCYQDRCEGALIEQSVRDKEIKAMQATIDSLQAEVERLKKLTEWQPIETAPKGYDGHKFTRILFKGYSKASSFSHDVYISGYMDSEREPVYFYRYKLVITHWMPLPESPNTKDTTL